MTSHLLATRAHAVDIFQAGLRAVAPGAAIKKVCHLDGDHLIVESDSYNLKQYEQIVVIGAGKAGASMAKALEDILSTRITRGLVAVKYGHVEPLDNIELVEAGHPVPDENGTAAAARIFRWQRKQMRKPWLSA